MERSTHAMQLLGKCLTSYGDPEKFDAALQEFTACHCPYTPDSSFTAQKHSQVLCFVNMPRLLGLCTFANRTFAFYVMPWLHMK